MVTYTKATGKFSSNISLPTYLEECHDDTEEGIQE